MMAISRARVTIKDVAERAGVSWKTVSNVVHERPHVAPSTRARVQTAIDELGYVPNALGRDLRGGPTRAISLVVPELMNPYFARLAERLQVAARGRGWSVSVEVSLGDRSVERTHAAGRSARPFDAVALSPSALRPEDVVGRTGGPRLILLGEAVSAQQGVVHIAIDNIASAVDLVGHLAEQGRSRILFLGADTRGPSTGAARLTGYRAAVRSHRLEENPALMRPVGQWSVEEGRRAMAEALAEGADVDAVIGGNDLLALGAAAALRAAGREVGGGDAQVAVAGWDDIPAASLVTPALTSIAPDMDALTEAILEAATSAEPPTGEVVIPHRLMLRGSTAREP